VLGLFFGSREKEIDTHAQILKDTAQVIYEQYPDLHIVIPTVPRLEYEVKQVMQDVKYPFFVLLNPDEKWDEFAACDVALAVSGTVGLELAYMGVPHAVTYKMHPVSWLLVKLLVKSKYAHLANILLNEPAVPEYLQGKADAFEISKGILKLFKDEDERKIQKEKSAKLREILSPGAGLSPSAKAAAFVLEVSAQPPKKFPVKKPAAKKSMAKKPLAKKKT
jgi:lipid-A-disaccharide synthase